MFGTLVICLPSAHQGGEVVVKHRGREKVFKTSEAAQSFACWYGDVSHEVLPVTSGYRWVLTYNLALDPAKERASAGLQRSETRLLRHMLRRWLAKDESSREVSHVYHVLDHDYTEASISLKALKTRDLAQVQALKEVSGEVPVEIFLALLEMEELGCCEDEEDDEDDDEPSYHHIDEVFETKYRVKTLVDLEGCEVARGLGLDEDCVLQDGCFEDIEAEEEYEGYMGNSVSLH